MGLLRLVAAVSCLLLAGGFVSCCFRFRSWADFLLAAYVLGWSWLVAVVLLLSPPQLETRSWLGAGIALSLVIAVPVWLANGRPPPPPIAPGVNELRRVLRHPAVLVLAIAVAIGFVYSVALAVCIPAGDWDALVYHLPRAAFWKQSHGLGYIAGAVDSRLDGNPPDAEIGQLATMILSGNDRYVVVPQIASYVVLIICVARLSRLVGLETREAAFGALAFATFPVVLVQASSALNDLVVASFLATTVVFLLQRSPASLGLASASFGLALGTKFTALLALPTLVVAVAAARPRREWGRLAAAVVAGVAVGSTWYIVNLVETGSLDGGLGASGDQRSGHSPAATAVTATRLAVDLIDSSGASARYRVLFVVAALVLLSLILLPRIRRTRLRGIVVAAEITAAVVLIGYLYDVANHGALELWRALGAPSVPFIQERWAAGLNVRADPTVSWFGPLGLLLVALGTVAAFLHWPHGPHRRQAIAFALAPWVFLVTFALIVTYDPTRGRFFIFAMALAASTWGWWLRHTSLAAMVAAIGTTTLVLVLATYVGKPSGIGELVAADALPSVTEQTIWGAPRWDAETRQRRTGEQDVFRYVEVHVPTNATIAVEPRFADYLFPYFGRALSRRVLLVPPGGSPPAVATWLVLSPSRHAFRCRHDWRQELSLPSGWRVERRNPESNVRAKGCSPE